MNILINKSRISILFLFVSFLVMLFFAGCLDKSSDSIDNQNVNIYLPDDKQMPAVPVWKQVQPEVLMSRIDENALTERTFAVYLEWEKVLNNVNGEKKENIIGYKIYRDNKNKSIAMILNPDITHYEDTNRDSLTEGSTHSYYVSAIDSLMRESMSDAQFVELKVGGEYPTAPRNVFTLPSEDKAVLYWSPPSNSGQCLTHGDEIVSYKVMRRDENGSWETKALCPAESRMFIDGNIVVGKHYYYQLFAVTKIGNVGLGSEIKEVSLNNGDNEDLSSSTAPTNIHLYLAETGKSGNIRLQWSPPKWNDDGKNGKNQATDVVAYKIYRLDSDTFNTKVAETGSYKFIDMVYNQQEYIDNTVDINENGKYYFYKISALDAKNHESDLSYPISYYLENPTKASKVPENFWLSTDNNGKITFHWKLDKSVEKYYLYNSKNTKSFDEAKEIDVASVFKNLRDGDDVSYIPGFSVTNPAIVYYKLKAFDNAYTFRSNFTYYSKAETYSLFQDNRMILYPSNIANLVEARSINYAWNALNLYGTGEIAENSLWNYDIRRGIHYRIEQETINNEECLVLDSMGTQAPPADSPENVFSSIPITDEITASDFTYADLSSTRVSTIGKADTVRGLMSAVSVQSVNDLYEKYYYISAYNDDGLSFWSDASNDGVGINDFYYKDSERPLLDHGMEGDYLKLDEDVDPWTYYGAKSEFGSVRVDESGFEQFWERANLGHTPTWNLISREVMADQNWKDYNPGATNYGGCAYYIGPDSGKKMIMKDYFGEWLAAGNTLEVKWVENYFGDWITSEVNEQWPTSSEVTYFFDQNTYDNGSITTENSLYRPIRKDNTLGWDPTTGYPIDYKNSLWTTEVSWNNYDAYQEEFRFKYIVSKSGNFKITMFFENVHGETGAYLLGIKKNGIWTGGFKFVSDTYNSDYINWPSLNLIENDRLEFYFFSLGSQNMMVGTDVYDSAQYTFTGNNSPCQLFVSRIEFQKQ